MVAGSLALSQCGGEPFSDAADGGPDATSDTTSDAAVDAGSSFCANQTGYVLCADFDEGPLAKGWDVGSPSIMGNATLGLDGTNAASPPNSVLVQTLAPFANSLSHATLLKTLPSGTVKVDLQIRVDRYGASDGGAIMPPAATVLRVAFDTFALDLRLRTPTDADVLELTAVGDAGSAFPHAMSSGPAPGKWTELALEVIPPQGANTKGALDLKLDGTEVCNQTLSVLEKPLGGAELEIGISAQSAESTWQIHFDNVLVSVQ
jgi:hypothetical protein